MMLGPHRRVCHRWTRRRRRRRKCWPQWRRAVLFRLHRLRELLVNKEGIQPALLVAGMGAGRPMTSREVEAAAAVVAEAVVMVPQGCTLFLSTGTAIVGVQVRLAMGARA